MFVTVTFIELHSPWQFFALSNHGRKIQAQAKRSEGFVRMKNTGWWRHHYTLSIWKSEAEMKQFARSGAHLEAMKQSAKLATVLSTYTYQANELPSWTDAKRLLHEKGKQVKFG